MSVVVVEKFCTKCLQPKPLTEFGKSAKYKGGVRSWCKECCHTNSVAWQRANPAKVRSNKLFYKYGISQYAWDKMFERQGFMCAICGALTPKGKHWHTDHDHKTLVVRGILCSKCNVDLGTYERLHDNPTVRNYLRRAKR